MVSTTLRASTVLALAMTLSPCTRREPPEPEERSSDAGGAANSKNEDRAAAPGGTVTLKGSDTMVILAQRWAEIFMRTHPGFTIQVTGGGSGTGIAALINGITDIADASRPMKDQEKAQLRDRQGKDAHEVKVAVDALAVYVPTASRVQELSIEQVRGIYTGRITNWREVGGANVPIVLYGRENNSGTYAYFKEHVLEDADFTAETQTLPGTAAVINAVARDRNGIGYGGIAYGEGVRALRLKPTAEAAAIEPNLTTATNGTYPLARFLYFYTAGQPTGSTRAFIDWVLSAEGQAVIENVGYYPLPREGQPPASAGTTPAPGGG